MKLVDVGALAISDGTWPATRSFIAGPPPLTFSNTSHSLLSPADAPGVITVGAVAGLTTVILVMYFGLTRVLLAISRDGLLPGVFSHLNKGGNPSVAIISTGILMALLGGLVPLDELGDIANIGTLGAFVIACVGVMVLRKQRPDLHRPFRVPGGAVLPVLGSGKTDFVSAPLPLHIFVLGFRHCLPKLTGYAIN